MPANTFCGFLCLCGCGQQCACGCGPKATLQHHLNAVGPCLGETHPAPGRTTEAGHVLPGPVLCRTEGCKLALGHHHKCLGVKQCQAILDGYAVARAAMEAA